MEDLLLDDNYDLQINNGDFVFGESSQQHVELLLILQKGELRESPHVGYGIEKRLKGAPELKRHLREMKVELESDGFINPEIQMNNLNDFKITLQ